MHRTCGKNRAIRLAKQLESLTVALQSLLRLLSASDVALNAEISGEAALLIVNTDVVAVQPDRDSVLTPLFAFAMPMAGIQHLADEFAPLGQIVGEDIHRSTSHELLGSCRVQPQHRIVNLGDPLV